MKMKMTRFRKCMAFVLTALLTCGVVYAAPANLQSANALDATGTETSWTASAKWGYYANKVHVYIDVTETDVCGGCYGILGPDHNLITPYINDLPGTAEYSPTGATETEYAFDSMDESGSRYGAGWTWVSSQNNGGHVVLLLAFQCQTAGEYKVIRTENQSSNYVQPDYDGSNYTVVDTKYATLFNLSDTVVADENTSDQEWSKVTWCYSAPWVSPYEENGICCTGVPGYGVNSKLNSNAGVVCLSNDNATLEWTVSFDLTGAGITSGEDITLNTSTSAVFFSDGTKSRISYGDHDPPYEATYTGSAGKIIDVTVHPSTEEPKIWVDADGNVQDNVAWETSPGAVTGYIEQDSGQTTNHELVKCVSTLTEKEILAHAEGQNCVFTLNVHDLECLEDGTFNPDDAVTALNASESAVYTTGKYIGLSLYKQIPDECGKTPVNTTLSDDITIYYYLPDNLVASSTVNRTYKILQAYDGGQYKVLDATYDEVNKRIRFKTNQFGNCVLVYKDEAKIKIIKVYGNVPSVFKKEYTKDTVLSDPDNGLPSFFYALPEGVGSPYGVGINWTVVGEYNEAPGAKNTFRWSIPDNERSNFNFINGAQPYGTVTIYNKQPVVTSITPPAYPTKFTGSYTSSDVTSTENTELGTTAAITLANGQTVNVPVSWNQYTEGGLYPYSEAPLAENSFEWVVNSTDYSYDFATNSITSSGAVKIKNKGITITATSPLVYPVTFDDEYTARTVTSDSNAQLGKSVTVTLENNESVQLPVSWSCANYDSAQGVENTFTWTIQTGDYDAGKIATTGEVKIRNKAAAVDTSKKVTATTTPAHPVTFDNAYTAGTVTTSANSELATTAAILLANGATVTVPVTWSCTDYNASSGAENTFTWTIQAEGYDTTGVTMTGEVKIRNKAAASSTKVTSTAAPVYPVSFDKEYTASTVTSDSNAQLGKSVTVTLETGATITLPVSWSCATYDSTEGAENTFTWTIQADGYDATGVTTTGNVKIKNVTRSSSSDSDDDDDDDDSYSTGKDDKGNTGGGTTTTDPTTPVDPTPTTPVTPDPTTPVTPVTPDPTTPVTPDPATPTTPDQGGTGNAGTTDQGNAGQSSSDNGNGSGNGGSSAGTTSDRDSDDDRDSSSSSHRGNSTRGNSSSSSSSTGTDANGTSAGTTDDAATNGSEDGTGSGAGSQSGNVSGITASIVTDATSIAETVKTKLDNALASVLKKDSKVQTGPYVQSDSDDIKVEIPSDLQKSGRTFYLMTAKDNGDIVILSNESSEDGVFEATGEAGTDYMMIFEDGETPLAAMITNDGTLNVAEDSNCYNHLIGLGLALIGLAAAALLARKGKRYFWAASAAGLTLALVASATGSCHLDWICFAGEAVVAVAATAALWMKAFKKA